MNGNQHLYTRVFCNIVNIFAEVHTIKVIVISLKLLPRVIHMFMLLTKLKVLGNWRQQAIYTAGGCMKSRKPLVYQQLQARKGSLWQKDSFSSWCIPIFYNQFKYRGTPTKQKTTHKAQQKTKRLKIKKNTVAAGIKKVCQKVMFIRLVDCSRKNYPPGVLRLPK